MNLIYLVVWGVLALVVVIMIIYRSSVSARDDESLHVLDAEAAKVPQQVAIAHKLATIDRWGKIITAITVLYGLVLAALFILDQWNKSGQIQ